MENKNKKCSSKSHNEKDAIIYCPECKLYMCKKCEKFHSELFQNHNVYSLDNIQDIFDEYCQEKNHFIKMEYFCRSHNQLCCAACIAKIKGKGSDGKHKDCNVCMIEDIREEKRNKLKENIYYLEELSKTLNQKINKFKNNFEKLNDQKDEIKIKIQNIFTKIRNEINKREDIILKDLDKKFDDLFDKDFINKSEKLPSQIKNLIEKGKAEDNKWDNKNNHLNKLVNECIIIENNFKNVILINEKLKNFNLIHINVKFSFEECEFNEFLKAINSFGNIYCKNFIINNINVEENDVLDEEGIEKEAIETVVNVGKCSRQVAIRALRAHNGDPVEALLEIGK